MMKQPTWHRGICQREHRAACIQAEMVAIKIGGMILLQHHAVPRFVCLGLIVIKPVHRLAIWHIGGENFRPSECSADQPLGRLADHKFVGCRNLSEPYRYTVAEQFLLEPGGEESAIGLVLPSTAVPPNHAALPLMITRWTGAGLLVLFFVLLVGLTLLAATLPSQRLKLFDTFYRAGSLVFGSGHVVLPLLQASVVPPAG